MSCGRIAASERWASLHAGAVRLLSSTSGRNWETPGWHSEQQSRGRVGQADLLPRDVRVPKRSCLSTVDVEAVARLCQIVASMLLCAGLLLACSGPRSGSTKTESETTVQRVYRVQLRMTEEKTEAVQARSRATRWWKNRPASERPPIAHTGPAESSAVTIDWKPPFYRVRLGPFATRQQAEAVLQAARSVFPDAFVAPKRITNR